MFEQNERFRIALMSAWGVTLTLSSGERNPYKTIIMSIDIMTIKDGFYTTAYFKIKIQMKKSMIRMFGVSNLFPNFVTYSKMTALNCLQDNKYGTR